MAAPKFAIGDRIRSKVDHRRTGVVESVKVDQDGTPLTEPVYHIRLDQPINLPPGSTERAALVEYMAEAAP